MDWSKAEVRGRFGFDSVHPFDSGVRSPARSRRHSHEAYRHKRKRGEWFDLDAEDIEELSATLDERNAQPAVGDGRGA